MRRLILLRHAKSDRPAGVRDLERPLNKRGRRAAPVVGERIAAEG
ncbi:MAG: histidine phosphatase family protein, partial [Methylobacterium sp.]